MYVSTGHSTGDITGNRRKHASIWMPAGQKPTGFTEDSFVSLIVNINHEDKDICFSGFHSTNDCCICCCQQTFSVSLQDDDLKIFYWRQAIFLTNFYKYGSTLYV